MPPQLAARFTPAEQAVRAVVAREMQKRQVCVLPVDAIAALAGVCSRLAQSAMRAAEAIGLILIRERRRPGMPSLTNVVTVVSKEWLGWLRRGPGGGGCKTLHPTDTFSFLQGAKPQNSRHAGRQESPRRRAPDASGDFAKGGRK